jgi:ferredoxin
MLLAPRSGGHSGAPAAAPGGERGTVGAPGIGVIRSGLAAVVGHGRTREEEHVAESIRVLVDTDVCTGNGMCVRVAPQVFEIADGADVSSVLMAEVSDPALIELAEEAEQVCPTLAIKIER